ncbi:succinylglutamate desuccinylase [Aliiglaciecola sp. CAU 1673]|uniref:succinylglutamate desuccinylase n=1 Tax=Aliiglaciecola sp. CAU 1673 TaxID=3032595 RepID=UPI0023DA5B52|nr:succinylglutamate desuccinylase [Aliiglaciecola sp. CAU 1673]MDF2180026.1 succinylglutamate desuccinylase [Aliiglaciecola sp. CAU 1673]
MQRLMENGDFLQLSRFQPEVFDKPLQFSLDNGTKVSITAPGIVVLEPASPKGKNIVLSCGVHGNETAPIEICDELLQALLTGKRTAKHRVLFLFGNLAAMNIGERFVEENMNRLFSGAHSKDGIHNAERSRAKLLEEAVAEFFEAGEAQGQHYRCHYDLHTAIRASKNDKFAVYPFLHGKPHSKEQLSLLLACGVNTILLSQSATTTFSYFSSYRFGADAFTVELGKVKPFGENDMRQFAEAKDTLTKLVTEERLELPPYRDEDFNIFTVNQVVNRTKEDFRLNFPDDAPNFTDYPVGYVLAEESGATYKVEKAGEAIVFPNAKVAIGQRALLTVVPTKI